MLSGVPELQTLYLHGSGPRRLRYIQSLWKLHIIYRPTSIYWKQLLILFPQGSFWVGIQPPTSITILTKISHELTFSVSSCSSFFLLLKMIRQLELIRLWINPEMVNLFRHSVGLLKLGTQALPPQHNCRERSIHWEEFQPVNVECARPKTAGFGYPLCSDQHCLVNSFDVFVVSLTMLSGAHTASNDRITNERIGRILTEKVVA
jgi:hypothetical protein